MPRSVSDHRASGRFGDQRDSHAEALHVEVLTDYRDFIEIEPTWNRLVEEAGIDFPFVRHEWIRGIWDSFDQNGQLHVLVVKEQNRTIAVAPLMKDRARMYGIPVRRVRGIANVYTERFDAIVSPRPHEASAAIWGYLVEHADEWDVVELRQLPEGCAALEHLPRSTMSERLLLGEWPSAESPFVPLTQPWDAYYQSLKKQHRATMRKSLQHLESQASVGFDVVQSGQRLDADIDEALDLEAVAWKERDGTAIKSRPDSAAFYRHMLHKAAQRGWLRLYFLTLGGKRIAVRLALLFRNKLYKLKSGYDPQYASWSPGHVLCHKIIEDAWRQGYAEVDFLGSAEPWKLNWSRDIRRHCWLFVFPKRPKARLVFYLKFHLLPRLRGSWWYASLLRAAATFDGTIQTRYRLSK